MAFSGSSRPHEQTRLLDRDMAKPKLTVKIPRSQIPEPAPKLLGRIDCESSNGSDLDSRAVFTGTFSNSPVEDRAVQREACIWCTQHSGQEGWNDYLHWAAVHPGKRPQGELDPCSCEAWTPRSPRYGTGHEMRPPEMRYPCLKDQLRDMGEKTVHGMRKVAAILALLVLLRAIIEGLFT